MRLTPLDIRKQEFRKAMRGLDAEEVYAFLSTVGDEYEAILNDNKAFKERLLELDDKVQEYRSMEKNLRNTLLTAERLTVEAKDNARREANIIIKEAQIEAEKALRDIKSQAMKLRQEVSQLRSQRESYLGRMKVIAESLLKFIESVETDFNEEDEAFQAAIPEETHTHQEMLLADPPAENGDLFDETDDTYADVPGSAPADNDKPESTRENYRTAPAPYPGGATEMTPPGVVDSRDAAPPVPRQPAGAGEKPVTGEAAHRPRSSLADIDAIIERMAAGQKETTSRAPQPTAGPAERPAAPRYEFVPQETNPTNTTAGGSAGDVKPEATKPTSNVAETQQLHRVSTQTEGKHSPEVATAIETPAEEVEQVQTAPDTEESRRVPSGMDVTSEMSLNRIRQDLEKQMARDKADEDR